MYKQELVLSNSKFIIGATKIKHIEDVVCALKLKLTSDEIKYLEELYRPHKVLGALDKEN